MVKTLAIGSDYRGITGTELDRSNPRLSTNTTTLTIHSIKKEDAGVYTCLATSVSGLTAEASARVVVSGSSLIEYGPSNQSILIGSNVHIPCKLSDEFAGRSDLWTTWTRNVSFICPYIDISFREISF